MFTEIKSLIRDIIRERKLVRQFSLNDFKARYAGSMMGIVWAFINPLVMVFTYWIVFTKVMRGAGPANVPYIVFLMTGMVAWFYFSDSFVSGTGVFREYSYLVKKVVFNVRILPPAKILSNFYTHSFFLIVTFAICFLYGFYPSLYTLQLIYYILALTAFLMGLTWITSSIQPFFPDISQLINVFMQAMMWGTPVLYDPSGFSPMIQRILKLNPLYYVVEGYRDAFLGRRWFWESPKLTLYFWCFTAVLWLIGAALYKRLKPHFSDVL